MKYAISMTVCGLFLLLAGIATEARQPETAPAGGGDMGVTIALPPPDTQGRTPLEQTLARRQSHRHFQDRSLSMTQIGQILWAAQGVGADGRRRTAPSAGATYPLEIYLVAGRVDELPAGIYHYEWARHHLVPVKPGDARDTLAAAALDQRMLATAPATVVVAAEYSRTAARYGERAERYVHMEAGHVAQNIYLQAAALKMGTVAVGAFRDAHVKALLGIAADPLYLMPLGLPGR